LLNLKSLLASLGGCARSSRSFFLVVTVLHIDIIVITGVIRTDNGVLAVIERGSWKPLQFLAS
jgi:hypothetical protein